MHMPHMAARFARSARAVTSASLTGVQYCCNSQQRSSVVLSQISRQSACCSPAPAPQSGIHQLSMIGPVSRTPLLLGSSAHRTRCRTEATLVGASGADEEAVELDEAVEVDVLVEGDPLPQLREEVARLAESLQADGRRIVEAALQLEADEEGTDELPEASELSVVLCDDAHIRALNQEWRAKDAATDVLSFPMDDDMPEGYPVRILGDVVISLDTAQRQAQERGHTLQEECRILLLHGVLHLLGQDHELGAAEADAMGAAEQAVMVALGWRGSGLIEAAGGGADGPHTLDDIALSDESAGSAAGVAAAAAPTPSDSSAASAQQSAHSSVTGTSTRRRDREIRLVALDMDGTLLDSNSRVLPSSVAALRATLAMGVMVIMATGKARPAAIAALTEAGLAGDGLLVSPTGPGIFLQGLAVHGLAGQLLSGYRLNPDIVKAAFQYAEDTNTPLCAFMGDDCATLTMHPELQELHQRYYEPLARVGASLEELVELQVKKLLFMTDAAIVDSRLKPHWQAALQELDAETMQAVSTMLEIVPRGVNKWVGMQRLLLELDLPAEAVMAVGDGGNDFELVLNCGVGVAMANAIPKVLECANFVTSNNDNDGVAEALERFLL